jgi:transcriptional regulator with XRE-family HTH domain
MDSDEAAAARLGRRLRARRTLLARTIASVALDAGLSVPYVANLENGRGNPTLSALRRLAAALGLTLGELLATADTGDTGDTGDTDGAESKPATGTAAGELRRFTKRERFRDQVRWLAGELGEDEGELRARIVAALRAMPVPAHRRLDASDWQRLMDALVLTLLPRP